MSRDFKDKNQPLDKVIELGSIDRWLRGIAEIVPHPIDPGHSFTQERDMHAKSSSFGMEHLDANVHVLPFNSRDLINDRDIEGMKGFLRLMNAAARRDVRVDVASVHGDALEITFAPDEPFSQSKAFGASYVNVIPAFFGGPRR